MPASGNFNVVGKIRIPGLSVKKKMRANKKSQRGEVLCEKRGGFI